MQYHLYHALGLIVVGIITLHYLPSFWIKNSGWLMVAGIILFSGSLYILSITQIRWFGAITPLGGMALILAWLCLGIGVIRQ